MSGTDCVVSLAVGGLYGPFPNELSARAWASREYPRHVWNVIPLTRVDDHDANEAILRDMCVQGMPRRGGRSDR